MAKTPRLRETFFGYVRLTPAENIAQGFTRTARRYVAAPELTLAMAGEKVDTLSNRAFDQFRNVLENRPVRKEAATMARRKGVTKYRTGQAAESADYIRRTRHIRRYIKEVTKSDVRLIDKKERKGWKALTDGEKERFHKLFDKYPQDSVLYALGSPPVKR